ncbi:GNAT family N-acetyltransferase [Sulfitobacter sp. LCG007]
MLADGEYDVPPGKFAVVVTHLEMRAPPPERPARLPEGVGFQTVSAPGAAWYRELFTRVGALDWLWSSRLKLTDDALAAILADPDVEVSTLTVNGRDEALLELDFRHGGACELAFFGLTSALIGSGCGRWLMNRAILRAFERPITRFHVHTCTADSPQALAFYRRSGFEPVRQQIEIADDPRLAGLIPENAAPGIPIFRPGAS